jgi:prophage regulatory protein
MLLSFSGEEAVANSEKGLKAEGFVRLREIIGPSGVIPISRSSWYAGVKDGRFPKPVKLGPRISAWRVDEIRDFIHRLGSSQ